jgi:ABC-type multidrug transport system fused ATPase/permease subunit
LDEATASIDRETAAQIQQVMHEEMKESTVITIAHRLEAVKNADYCIVLGNGRIVKQGPAEEMLREGHVEEVVKENVEEEEESKGDGGEGGPSAPQ